MPTLAIIAVVVFVMVIAAAVKQHRFDVREREEIERMRRAALLHEPARQPVRSYRDRAAKGFKVPGRGGNAA